MCGINGIVRLDPAAPPVDREELLRTRDAMARRGPDGEGEWISASGRAGLGHRRLAILDPSPAGAQPMLSADGRQAIVLNGEIYNFRQLRSELAASGHVFRSHSDTEILLALWAREREAMLPRLRGMYTLAIWDEERGGELFLARDPLGIKPLYYSESAGTRRFASQVKALERGGAVPVDVDPAGLAGFLLWGSVPEPWTIRRGVKALPAGCWLRVREGRIEGPVSHYRFGQDVPAAPLSAAAAVDDSVRAHLVSDVPVAIFLSAGLDSSLITALARRHLPEPPLTFTLRFDELRGTPLDEAPLAAETARLLGTRHVEGRVGRDEFLGLWDEALAAMDQPSIDGFNTFLVSRAAHAAGIKVVLSGLGGDEVFGSYPSFQDVPRSARLVSRARRLPGLAALWPAAARLSPDRPKLGGLLRHGGSLAGAYFLRRGLYLPEELPTLLGEETARAGLDRYQPTAETAARLAEGNCRGGKGGDPWTAVHLLETAQYLRNQLLRDADWAAMASSVELRVPFVDAVLREHLAAAGFEPARSSGKAALVRQAAPELPAALWERPKSGFYVPVMDWLDGQGGGLPGPAGRSRRMGADSRRLARRVLGGFGVDLPVASSAGAGA